MFKFQYESYSIIDKALVDGEMWYTIMCTSEISLWLRQQEDKYVHRQPGDLKRIKIIHDIHEKILTMLTLKWSNDSAILVRFL